MKRRIKCLTKKSAKIVLSLLMLFTTLNLSSISNVFASKTIDVNDYPMNETLKYNGKISWDGSIVGDFTIGGKQAFCMAHPKPTPGSGTKLTSEIYKNENVRKVLFYGWEGPQQWSGFTSKAKGVVITSLALSYYYYGDKSSNNIDEFLNYIKNKSVPDYTVSFNKNIVNAYKSENIQKTETIELSSKSNMFGITIKLHDKMTYVDESHNTKQTGGNVTIKGQTRFHFEAPLNINLGSWYSGTKTSFYAFQPILSIPAGNLQPSGRGEMTTDPSKTTSLQINWLSLGDLKIKKQDNKGNNIPNTKFKVSYNSDMSNAIGTYTTGSDGSVTIYDLTPQKVYIQEVSVPDNLVLDQTVHLVDIQTGDTTTFTKTNLQKGNLRIAKVDNKGNNISNTSFRVSYNSDMSSPLGTYTTDSNGTVTLEKLNLGKIYIQEINVPDNLVLDNRVHEVEIKTGETTYFTQTNNWKQGRIQVIKKDAQTGKIVKKSGTIFDIYNKNNTKIESIVTNDDGVATSSLLDYGEYYVKESQAPNGFVINVELNEKVGVVENDKTYEVSVANQQVKGTVNMTKEDNKTGSNAQGDATLENAKYGIYARENIMDPSNDGTVLYHANDKVAEMTTNSEGKSSAGNLNLGKYYLKEIEASYGYNLDTTEYDFELTYENQNVDVVTKNMTVYERVISQAFSIIKVSSDKPGEADLLEGAEFTVKWKADVDKLGWDKAPIAKNADGNEASVLVTDKKGYAVSDRLPIGQYVVRETKTPTDKYQVDDFTVTITEDSSDPQVWRVFNDTTFMSVVAIVKQDAETGKTIKVPGAEFKIKNLDTGEYVGYWEWFPLPHFVDSWKTNEDGAVMTGEKLRPGSYQLEEIKSPEGYLISEEPVKFTIHMNQPYETLPDEETPVITVIKKDTSVKGRITVEKTGDVLTGFKDENFIYQNQGIPNVKFEIFAREDIMDPSNDGTILYKKGTVVETVTTGTQGKTTSKNLPLGEYGIREVQAPDGFVLNTEEKQVELKYKDQNTAIVYDDVTVINDRQKVDLNIIKKDANEDKGIDGAEFTLYAKSDIKNINNETIVYKDQAICKVISSSNGKAKFDIDLPLKNGFYIEETKAPIGYSSTDTRQDFITDYKGQDTLKWEITKTFQNEPVIVEISKQDITTNAEVAGNKLYVLDQDGNKIDSWTSKKGEKHIIKYLHVGETYTLVEELAASGYLKAKDVKFTIKDTGEVQRVEMKDELVQGQIEITKVGEKLVGVKPDKSTDGNMHFEYQTKSVQGAKFEVYASEDIKHPDNVTKDFYKKGDLVATLTTDENGIAKSEKLPLGKYTVKEIIAGDGFVLNTVEKDVELRYRDQLTPIVFDQVNYVNVRQKVEIDVVKKDFENSTRLYGAVFGIFAKQDIIDYKGNVVIKKGDLVYTARTNSNGHAHIDTDLPLSKYEIRELQAPIGYSSTDEVFEIDATYKDQKVDVIKLDYEFKNKITKVEVSKQDITDSSEIEGAHLTVFEKDDPACIFESWISGQDGKNEDGTIKPHLMKGLEPGKTYILRETSSPYGFAIAQDVEFTVEDTGEIQKVVMKDEVVFGQLEWNKTGEIFNHTEEGQNEFGQTSSPVWEKSNLLGAEITIYAGEDITIGNTKYYSKDEKVETLESDWDAVTSKKLPVGHYYYVESKVPHGYIVNTDKHHFEVKDNQRNELQVITSTLANERAKVNIDMTKALESQKVFVNKDAYKDVLFGIYAREDIYDYMGKIAIENGTMIATSPINEKGHLVNVPDLPNGIYYIKELATNNQYVLNDKEYDFEIAYHGQDISKYTIQINEGTIDNKLARGTIQVQKVDTLDAEKKLEGIEFNISSNKDMKDVISTVKTNADGMATFEDLELGTYYIQEAKQVNGYTVNNHIYQVEVKMDGDLLTIQCENKPVEMEFSKVDETSVKELAGATIEIVDKETNEVVDKWVSDETSHNVKYLVEGKEYIMREISSPYGYEVTEEITFIAGDGKKVVMKNMPILTDIKVNKLDSQTMKPVISAEFEFTMYTDPECTKAVITVKADTKNGTATFKDVRYGVWYIKETEAPKGYKLSDEVKKIVIDDKLDGVGETHSFTYLNTLLPTLIVKTEDDMPIGVLIIMSTITGIGIFLTYKKKKKELYK